MKNQEQVGSLVVRVPLPFAVLEDIGVASVFSIINDQNVLSLLLKWLDAAVRQIIEAACNRGVIGWVERGCRQDTAETDRSARHSLRPAGTEDQESSVAASKSVIVVNELRRLRQRKRRKCRYAIARDVVSSRGATKVSFADVPWTLESLTPVSSTSRRPTEKASVPEMPSPSPSSAHDSHIEAAVGLIALAGLQIKIAPNDFEGGGVVAGEREGNSVAICVERGKIGNLHRAVLRRRRDDIA